MIYPTGILKNTETGGFHPIPFRMAPMPGGADSAMTMQRYKSVGHHTDGYPTIDEAKAYIATKHSEDHHMIFTGDIWDWDGNGMPAMVEFFSLDRLVKDATPAHD
jgi:hypothetical protein